MKLDYVFFLFILGCSNIYSQIIKGEVFDAETKLPLVYANVVLNNQNYGVVTNESGYFDLKLSKTTKSDSLIMSYLGYHKKVFSLSDFSSNEAKKNSFKRRCT